MCRRSVGEVWSVRVKPYGEVGKYVIRAFEVCEGELVNDVQVVVAVVDGVVVEVDVVVQSDLQWTSVWPSDGARQYVWMKTYGEVGECVIRTYGVVVDVVNEVVNDGDVCVVEVVVEVVVDVVDV